MDRVALKNLIRINHNFKGRPLLLDILSKYLTEEFTYKLKKNKVDIPFFHISVVEDPGNTAHYLYNSIHLDIYSSQESMNVYSANIRYKIGVHEQFGNCGMVCLNNLASNNYYDNNKGVLKILLELGEDVVDLFGYSNIIYTASNQQNKELILILKKTYKEIEEFNNKRMGTKITVYSKTL